MSNLEVVVKSLAEESEKIGYDPTKDTNWCDIPPEILMECIKKMNFETRCRLRCTSKKEKSLVEAKKYHFDKFCIRGPERSYSSQYSVSAINGSFDRAQESFEVARQEPIAKKHRFVELVMNTCEVYDFFLYYEYECPPMEPAPLFRCWRFFAKVNDWSTIRYFLEKCHPLEMVDISLCDIEISRAAAHPMVFNATKIVFGNCEMFEFEAIADILRRWIETNASTEKSLRFTTQDKAVPFFTEKFADRVVYANDVKALIRMDDPRKQVLVWIADFNMDWNDYVKLRVIPTGLPKSEYSESIDWDCYSDVPVSSSDSDSEIDDSYDYESDGPEDNEPAPQMQNVMKAVLNVAGESEKCGYNPETDTNWCHLPMEMRAECIKRMGFTSRICLSITSTTEHSLANPKTYRFDAVRISDEGEGMIVSAWNETNSREHVVLSAQKSPEKKLQFAVRLCKTCEIEEFYFMGFNSRRDGSGPETQLGQLVPFRFKRFLTNSFDPDGVRYILNNCTELERITVYNNYMFNVLTDFPQVINIKELRVGQCEDVGNVWALIHKWIEVDAEVGKSIQFRTQMEGTDESFASEFADRIVEDPDDGDVAIRMNHRSKQIILMKYVNDSVHDEHVSCRVIDTDGPVEHGEDDWLLELLREEEEEMRNYPDSDSDFE